MKANNYILTCLGIFLPVLLSLNACSNSAPEGEQSSPPPTVIETSFPTETPIEFEVLKFNAKRLPDLSYQGEIADGAHWQDETGLNYFLITLKKGKSNGKQESSSLYAYQFNRSSQGKSYMNVWEYRVDMDHPLEAFKTHSDMIEIVDLNGDNKGEVLFSHLSQPAKGDPVGLSTVLTSIGKLGFPEPTHINGGYPARSSEDGGSGDAEYEQYPSENFESLLPEFKEKLSLLWDEQIEKAKELYNNQ